MNTQLHQLLHQNPAINLGTVKLHDAAALQQLNWDGLDPATVLPQLLAYQRLWRLHPDTQVVQTLLDYGIGSAHQIVAMGLDKFKQLVGAALRRVKPTPRLAADIHAAALQTTAAVAQYAIHAIPSEFMSVARFDTRTSGLPDFHGDSPTYRELFGPITAGPCNDCDSIFSPAAYFVDLMQLIDEYISHAPGNNISGALQLQTRRPDLWNILLNCENTVKELPYLQLANGIMASTLKPYLNGVDPWEYAATHNFPFQLPYNKPLEEIRAYAQHFGLTLAQVYAALACPETDIARERLGMVPETYTLLKSGTLNELEAAYGVASLSNLSEVSTFLQQTGLEFSDLQDLLYQGQGNIGSIQQVPVLSINGQDNVECNAPLTTVSLDALSIEAWVQKSGTTNFGGVIVGNGPTSTLAGFNLYCNFGQLQFTLADGNQILVLNGPTLTTAWTHVAVTWDGQTKAVQWYINGQASGAVQTMPVTSLPSTTSHVHIGNVPTGGGNFYGNLSQVRVWASVRTPLEIAAGRFTQSPRDESGHLLGNWQLNEGSGTNIYNHAPGGVVGTLARYQNTGNFWVAQSGLHLHPQDAASDASLLAKLYVNSSLTNLFLSIEQSSSGLAIKTYDGNITYADAPNTSWAALNAVIRLSQVLGWSYADVDWALKTIGAAQPGHWTDANLEDLAGVLQLSQRFQQPVDAVTGSWHDLKTFGRGSGKDRKNFWDQTFNSPEAFYNPDNLAYPKPYRPQYTNNPYFTDTPLFLDIDGTDAADTQLRLALSQSLSITEPDLTAILDYVNLNSAALVSAKLLESVTAPAGTTLTASMIGLSVKNMTLLYRLAKLPQWLNMPIVQFLELLPLMGMTGFGTVSEVLKLEAEAAWLKQHQLSVPAYAFLLGNGLGKANLNLTKEQKEALEKSLLSGSQAVMLLPKAFESDTVSRIDALEIYACLIAGNVINDRGLVLSQRKLDVVTIASALAKSPALRQKYRLFNPEQRVLTFTTAADSQVTLPFDLAAEPTVIQGNSFTIAFWMYCTSWPGSGTWAALFSSPTDNNPSGGSDNGYKGPQFTLPGDSPGNYQVAYADKNNRWQAVDPNLPPFIIVNTWTHAAWVNNNGVWTVYINGQPVDSDFQSGQTSIYQNSAGESYIGGDYDGHIADMNLWSKPLSQTEVQNMMYGQPDPDADGLVGFWPLNEGVGTAVTDYSSYKRMGTVTNSVWAKIPMGSPQTPAVVQSVLDQVVTAKERQSELALQKLAAAFRVSITNMRGIHALTAATQRSNLIFNQANAWVLIPYIPALASVEFTVSAWVNIRNSTGQWQGVFVSRDDQTGASPAKAYGFALVINEAGKLLLQIAAGSTYTLLTGTEPLPVGKWQNIAATFDGSTANIYVNGVVAVSGQAVTGYTPVQDMATIIGEININQPTYALNGAIADVRYYDTALPAATLATEMEQVEPRQSSMKAWWPLSAGSGTTIYDWSGNGYHGHLGAGAGASAEWQNLHLNALLQAEEEGKGDLNAVMQGLSLNTLLTRKFALDTADMLAMLRQPTAFGMTEPMVRGYTYTSNVLHDLGNLQMLKASMPTVKDQWLLVIMTATGGDSTAALSILSKLTGWPTGQIQIILTGVPNTNLTSLSGLRLLVTILDMASKMGVQPSFLLSLGQLSDLTAAGNTTINSVSQSNWSIYNGLSTSMSDALQAQYSEDQLESALAKVQGPLWEKERNILAALLLHFLKGVVNDVNSLQDLYEYLLVDVKMASNVQISRIEQALDGLQLYVNRCINGLETNATCYIPKAWWAWMGSYRQWQANREVYLYPENYADPSLRKAQTPLFKNFVNTLNQGQLTEVNIQKALGQYVVGMSDISNLIIVDSYARKLEDVSTGKVATELYVLGRSRQDPPTFYTRRGYLAPNEPMAWTAWEQLDFSIGADTATCIYAFNRLYLFWVQQATKSVTDTTVDNNPKVNIVEATIYFTFQKLDGTWLQPQTLAPAMPIYMEEFGYVVLSSTEPLKIAGWNYEREYWLQKPWKQVRLTVLPATTTQEASILVSYGDLITVNTIAATGTSSSVECKDRLVWEKMLNQANSRAAAAGKGKVTTLFPAYVLTASGSRSIIDFSANLQHSGNFNGYVKARSGIPNASLVLGAGSVLQPSGISHVLARLRDNGSAFYKMDSLANETDIADYFNEFNAAVRSGGVGKVALASPAPADWNGKTRNVINFPGAGSCSAAIPNSEVFQFKEAITVAAWIQVKMDYTAKFNAGGEHPQDQIIFGNSDSGLSNGISFLLNQGAENDSWVMKVQIGSILEPFTLSGSNALSLNTWYHVAFTWDKSSGHLKFYLNGICINNLSGYTSAPSYSNVQASIGENYGWQGYFGGYIADLIVTDVALSDSDISALRNLQSFEELPSQEILLLNQVSSVAASVTTVANRTGLIFADTGSENFLCIPVDDSGFQFVEDILTVNYPNDHSVALTYASAMLPAAVPLYAFHRIDTRACNTFWKQLAEGGASALLQLQTQYTSEPSFSNYAPNAASVVAPASDLIDFNGPMREYLWELFFHIPLYVGNLLQTQQQFSAARKWYEFVFNPAGWQQKGLNAYWPLDGNLGAVVGTPAHFGSEANGWTTQTFVDGSTRTVLDVSKNYLNLDPSLLPQGDMVSIAFWLYGNFPTSNYQLSIPLINAATGTLPVAGTDTRLLDIFLLYNTSSDSTPSTSCYWEAGNDGINNNSGRDWDSLNHSDGIDNYNGAWSLFVFTKNAVTGSLKVYRNGSLWFGGTGYNRGIEFPAIKFTVGKPSSNTTPQVYNALITELSVWSIELNASQVASLYQNKTAISLISPNWNFRPFLETAPATLAQTLTSAPAQSAVYHYDPFDPDALAAIRWGAWEKNIFMAYIRNLIGWGDSLFTVDTWEAVSEATQLYVTAGDLLGVPPKPANKLDLHPKVTYGQIEAQYGPEEIHEFLIDMETKVTAGAALPGGGTMPAGVASILNGYFCIPDNEQLTQLWGLVANRLYKIRHGLNLQGQATQPALFGPPLNPADLVDGGAYGASGPAEGNNVQVPYYRFDQMIQLSKSFTQQVVSLGNELLAALEKQDGETLSQLRQTQESAIFNMTLQAKADLVNQLMQTQAGLQYGLASAQTELKTIQGWAAQVLLPQEGMALESSIEAFDLNIGVAAIKASSSIAYLIPDIFGLADGGMDFGDSVKAIAEAMSIGAQLQLESAGLNKEIATYIRREQEWNLRIQTISDSIGQINAQLAANQYAISAAQQDYSITQTQYQQSQDVLNFLQTKFTNEDLYVWMAGQLSTLYYQAYQMALELAQQAQTCYQYELSSSDTFLTGNPWNDQYKGLLAGDALSLSLAQMEKAYHDNNSRYQEIHKTFSLMQKNPQALLDLKKNGSCKFSFTELDFDLDFPGHYNRKIASISVTIPAVVGPYQNLNATLIQTSNQVLVRPDINGVKHLLGLGGTPSNGAIRANWSANQQISISTGINDAGMFQLNFNDPQYLPFEGTGAVSDWELIMPKAANAFDFAAITDVIIQISYTASPGGQTFARQVTNLDLLKNYQGSLYLSLRQQYSSAWYAFLSTYSLNFNLLRGQFPNNLTTSSLNLGKDGNAYLALVLADPGEYSDLPTIALNSETPNWDPGTGAAAIGAANNFQSNSEVSWQLTMGFSSTTGGELLDGDRINPDALLDVILIVPFSGQLDWGI